MEKSKLYQLFLSLNASEKLLLRRFVNSPYHNRRDDVRDLYRYLLENYTTPGALRKAKLLPLLFPHDLENTETQLRQTMTFLKRAIEQFLVLEELKNRQVSTQIILSEVYRKKKLDLQFGQSIRKANGKLEQQALRDSSFHQLNYQLQLAEYAHSSTQGRLIPLNLQKLNDALDVHIIAEKLKRACTTLAHSNVFKTNYHVELIPEILQLVQHKSLLQFPAIAIYYHTYRALTEPDIAHFHQLKQTLFQHITAFATQELLDIFLLAINYCIRRINEDEVAFLQETFDLYQKGLIHEVFIQHQTLSRFTYKNIVSAALRLEKYDWAEQFIHQYQDKLAPAYRKSNYSYNLAKLYFFRKDYDRTRALLLKVEYDDIFLTLDSKNMLVQIYFELQEFEALESLLESMRTYLVRKKVIGYHKSNYSNIIRLTQKLTKINPYSKSPREKLRREIEEAQPLTERRWLLEQLARIN